jgi:hypothetical protein
MKQPSMFVQKIKTHKPEVSKLWGAVVLCGARVVLLILNEIWAQVKIFLSVETSISH